MKITRANASLGLFLSVLISMLPQTAKADDAPVYESLSDVPIGRVFFTPQQRIQLDKNRGVAKHAQPNSTRTGVAATKSDAAGFIISGSGVRKVYSNGDFIETASSAAVAFPGDVRVVRQPQVDEEASDDSD